MATTGPNVLVVMSDQHSFRYLGSRDPSTGGEPVDTPALDRLANASVVFDTAYCSTPLCTPSRYSFLSGREAKRAGGWNNSSVLDPSIPTLPGTLADSGYRTCLEGKMHLGGTVQFAGFDRRRYGDLTGRSAHQAEPPDAYSHPPDYERLLTEVGPTSVPESLLQEKRTIEESVSFLREHRHHSPDQPWFLCTSLSRPHWPRTAPRRFVDRHWPDDVPEPKVSAAETVDHPLVDACAARTASDELSHEGHLRARAGYFAAVEYVDELLGDYLARLDGDGFLENTIVIYMSDHGELAGEHGLWEKRTWHEAATRVPLFVQLPEHRNGSASGTTIDSPVSLVDLYPTVCGLVGVDPPTGLDGENLSRTVREGVEPDRDPVVVDCFGMFGHEEFHYRMLREDRYKYVRFRDAPELLFDVVADPFERRNLAEDGAGDADSLARLRDTVEKSIDFAAVDHKREQDRQMASNYQLPTSKGGPNQYHMPDGRVVDADTVLYHPHVISDDPSQTYHDYPER